MTEDVFERDGKRFGMLTAPHSRDDAAWGTLMAPVVCVRSGRGPTMLLTRASHGDACEGPVALSKRAHGCAA